MTPTTALANVRALLAVAVRNGLDVEAIRREAGLTTVLADEAVDGIPTVERRVPLETICAAWEAVLSRTADGALTLASIGEMPRNAFDVLELAVGTASTLGEAWTRAARYMALWSDASRFAVERVAGERLACTAWEPVAMPSRRGLHAAVEAAVASAFVVARRVSGERFVVSRVRFAHPARGPVEPYVAFFAAPVDFGAPRTEFVFEASQLDLPFAPTAPGLDAYLLCHAEDLLRRLPVAGPITTDVRRMVSARLADDPSVDDMARLLRLGARTLRRRLADEGTSYARIVDDVRREYASRALAAGRMGIGEIALTLGFRDPGAFVRAFRRWTGTTPGAWRDDARRAV